MTAHTTVLLVGDLVVIAVSARLLGLLAQRLGQPAVIGEILGGILLGPTLFHGAVTHALFPAAVQPALTNLANIGIAVFMFFVGLELDRSMLRGQGRIATSVALGSTLVPFGFGVLLAWHLLGRHPSTQPTAFVLFFGTAMAVTAFPVLARILTGRNLLRTPIGALSVASASLADILAWTLLAVVTALAGHSAGLWQLLLIVPFVAVLLLVVGPLLTRLAARGGGARAPGSPAGRFGALVAVLAGAAGLWVCAEATRWMGLHLIFGAFLFGVAVPRTRGPLAERVLPWVHRINGWLLLPIFFMIAGLEVDLSTVDGAALGELALILLVAIGGKGIGAFAGARLNGARTRHSVVLAILANTRGLTELIVLVVGLQLHLLDTPLYSLMVVMALVTTTMTAILLSIVYPESRARADLAPRIADPRPEAVP
ncbi:cation:proton antiporter [Nocardia sp. alder85J]|uniref:cation:proton antiporter domain-containing protein n=1 Tax=Nocardia sp. alder85J TaxID=2862949 RepID=UPI001CD1AF67|nr:cation:proton antiporter [Nocardia sp. alder85J]MCX4091620.1 cation:proton antiporter [Nocardia sp. alder85J]